MELESKYCAHNYHPLPVVLERGEGVHVWDDKGNRYIDMMSAYSAVSHGHCHPGLVRALTEQASRLCIVSRAFHTNRLAPFLQRACQVLQQDMALPMNTGSEAVETAIKAARKWAYVVKGVPHGAAEIIACNGNFHGRTITIVGLSTEQQYQDGFGPFPDGLHTVPYGDADALERAITPNTAAFLVEPIQGEGGIIIPPKGYLKACQQICNKHNVLMICDEVQTGLGRTGKILACEHEDVRPDGVVVGKALGGGLIPVSLFLCRRDVMSVFHPGDHGSTFGGNALAAAVGLAALDILISERLAERSEVLGQQFLRALQDIHSPLIKEVRGRGLFIGLEIAQSHASAREVCERLMQRGVLSKETHETVVRFAPPLVVTKEQLDWAVQQIKAVITDMETQTTMPSENGQKYAN